MSPRQRIVGVVLAGGESTRMGVDKALLRVGDDTLVASAARRLKAALREVVIADRGRGLVAGTRSVDDAAVAGPAAGLLGAALAFPGRPLLALACDLPAVPVELLIYLAQLAPRADLVVPASGARRLEPLCARWGPRALARLEARAAAGRAALHAVAASDDLVVRRVETSELARFGTPEALFRNLNTPADVARMRPPAAPDRQP